MSSTKSQTRNRILESAVALLKLGTSVRMSDVAKRAGISRQALYLHFGSRAALLTAATFHIDELKNSETRLIPSRTAKTGIERLDAYIDAWASYIPDIYGVAKAFWAMQDTDQAAADTWKQRMADMREGCAAAIDALAADQTLSPTHTREQATDILWTLLSIRNWEQLTIECSWSQQQYANNIKWMARRIFVVESAGD